METLRMGLKIWRARKFDGGCGRIRDALPVREVVGELTVSYQRIIEYKSYFCGF